MQLMGRAEFLYAAAVSRKSQLRPAKAALCGTPQRSIQHPWPWLLYIVCCRLSSQILTSA